MCGNKIHNENLNANFAGFDLTLPSINVLRNIIHNTTFCGNVGDLMQHIPIQYKHDIAF